MMMTRLKPRKSDALAAWVARQPTRMCGYLAIAKASGVRYQSVQKWIERGNVPLGRVNAVCRLTGLQPQEVNPDLAKALEAGWLTVVSD